MNAQTLKFKVVNGQLMYLNDSWRKLAGLFTQSLEEGQVVEGYFQLVESDATLAQTAKVHAMIRELALHSGESFDAMKLYVKHKAGLTLPSDGDLQVKSFADCSRQELTLAIEAARQIGQTMSCPVG